LSLHRAASPQGWNNIKYERVVYGCGDREGPTKLIGRKEFPILTGARVSEYRIEV